jgi:hypothetical protein
MTGLHDLAHAHRGPAKKHASIDAQRSRHTVRKPLTVAWIVPSARFPRLARWLYEAIVPGIDNPRPLRAPCVGAPPMPLRA